MQNKVLIAIIFLIIGILIGYIIGFSAGMYQALNWSVEKAQHFLQLKGINIEVRTGEIVQMLSRYKDGIVPCVNGSL